MSQAIRPDYEYMAKIVLDAIRNPESEPRAKAVRLVTILAKRTGLHGNQVLRKLQSYERGII